MVTFSTSVWLSSLLVVTGARFMEFKSRLPRSIPSRCEQNSRTTVSCTDTNIPGALLPHPDDCQLFYQCRQPYLPPACKECPANLHFNPAIAVCDWPQNAGCRTATKSALTKVTHKQTPRKVTEPTVKWTGKRVSTTTAQPVNKPAMLLPEKEEESTVSWFPVTDTTASIQRTNISSLCERNSKSTVSCADVNSPDALVPHPDDCQLFYYCATPHLEPVCRQCPDNLHFSPVSHVCDWPASAGCNGLTKVHSTTRSSATQTHPTTRLIQQTSSTAKLATTKHPTTKRHSTTTKATKRSTVVTPAPQTHPTTIWVQQTSPTVKLAKKTHPTTKPHSTTTKRSTVVTPAPQTHPSTGWTQQTSSTRERKTLVTLTPEKETVSSSTWAPEKYITTDKQQLSTPSLCERNSKSPVSCADVNSSDSLLPHPDNCELFYYCVDPDFSPVCRQCPAHLHFNPTLHVCDWPAQAGCNKSTKSVPNSQGNSVTTVKAVTSPATTELNSTPIPTNTATVKLIPEREEASTSTWRPDTIVTTNKQQQTIANRCERNSKSPVSCAEVNSPDALVPHPDDCQLFYYCLAPDFPPVCRECPQKMHFNPTLHVCDWPSKAGCKITTTTDPTAARTTPFVTIAPEPKTTSVSAGTNATKSSAQVTGTTNKLAPEKELVLTTTSKPNNNTTVSLTSDKVSESPTTLAPSTHNTTPMAPENKIETTTTLAPENKTESTTTLAPENKTETTTTLAPENKTKTTTTLAPENKTETTTTLAPENKTESTTTLAPENKTKTTTTLAPENKTETTTTLAPENKTKTTTTLAPENKTETTTTLAPENKTESTTTLAPENKTETTTTLAPENKTETTTTLAPENKTETTTTLAPENKTQSTTTLAPENKTESTTTLAPENKTETTTTLAPENKTKTTTTLAPENKTETTTTLAPENKTESTTTLAPENKTETTTTLAPENKTETTTTLAPENKTETTTTLAPENKTQSTTTLAPENKTESTTTLAPENKTETTTTLAPENQTESTTTLAPEKKTETPATTTTLQTDITKNKQQLTAPTACDKNSKTPVSCASIHSIDALLPHPDDCELFYYCVNSDASPICRQCPAKLHFNPSLHVCDWPNRAGCNKTTLLTKVTTSAPNSTITKSQETSSITQFPKETDTTTSKTPFSTRATERSTVVTPSSETHPTTRWTQLPSSTAKLVTTTHLTTVRIPETDTITTWPPERKTLVTLTPEKETVSTSTWAPETTDKQQLSTPTLCERNSKSLVSCADVNSPEALVPHPDDCQLFYYCTAPHLEPVCRQCPDNLHFNPVSHVCDWPAAAGCNTATKTHYPATRATDSITVVTPAPETHPTTRWTQQTPSTVKLVTTTHTTTKTLSAATRPTDSSTIVTPSSETHPTTRWPQLTSSTAKLVTTTHLTTVRIPETDTTTTWPPERKTLVTLTPEKETVSTSTWTTEKNITTDKQQLSTASLCERYSRSPLSCADVTSPDALVPHPDDCQLFYYCTASHLELVCRQCPDNLHFNPVSHVCDWPAAAGCNTAMKTHYPTTRATESITVVTPAPETHPTTRWTQQTRSTVKLETTTHTTMKTSSAATRPTDSSTIVTISSETHPTTRWTQQRPSTRKLVTTTHPNTVRIPKADTTTTRTPKKKTFVTLTPEKEIISTSTWAPEITERKQLSTPSLCERNSKSPVSCADVNSPDALAPHPDDCQLFYYCTAPHLEPVCRQCPDNLHFNPVSHVCDWPASAGCNTATKTHYPTTRATESITVVTPAPETHPTTRWTQQTPSTVKLETRTHTATNTPSTATRPTDSSTIVTPSSETHPTTRWTQQSPSTTKFVTTTHPTTVRISKADTTITWTPEKKTLATLTPEKEIVSTSTWAPETTERKQLSILSLCERNLKSPVSCADVNSPDALVPHPDDCQLFYYCTAPHLEPVCRQCPDNLHFNPVSHVCDWPASAGCNTATKTHYPATRATERITVVTAAPETHPTTRWTRQNLSTLKLETTTHPTTETPSPATRTPERSTVATPALKTQSATRWTQQIPSTVKLETKTHITTKTPSAATRPTDSSTIVTPSSETHPTTRWTHQTPSTMKLVSTSHLTTVRIPKADTTTTWTPERKTLVLLTPEKETVSNSTWAPETTDKQQLSTPSLCERNSKSLVSCADVNSSDALVPHPDDCQLFYYCAAPHLEPVCRQCPDNLHFSPVSHVCDWPASAGCNTAMKIHYPATRATERISDVTASLKTNPTTRWTQQTPSTVKVETTTHTTTKTPSPATREVESSRVLTAAIKTHTTYRWTQQTPPAMKLVSTTHPTTVWIPKTDTTTTWTTERKTLVTLTPEKETVSNSTWAPETTDKQQLSTPSLCERKSKSLVLCADVNSPDALVPHPDDCQLFYYCAAPHLEPVCRQCPDNLHFSPVSHVCDWPATAECDTPTKTQYPATKASNIMPVPTNVSDRWIPHLKPTSTVGGRGDEIELLPLETNVKTLIPYQDKLSETWAVKNATSETKVQNVISFTTKLPDTVRILNPSKFISPSKRKEEFIQTTPSEVRLMSKTETTGIWMTESDTSTSSQRQTTLTLCRRYSKRSVSCAHGPHHLLPHPDNCQLFYHCAAPHMPPLCRQCPDNMHFSPTSQVCDWPAAAGCNLTGTSDPALLVASTFATVPTTPAYYTAAKEAHATTKRVPEIDSTTKKLPQMQPLATWTLKTNTTGAWTKFISSTPKANVLGKWRQKWKPISSSSSQTVTTEQWTPETITTATIPLGTEATVLRASKKNTTIYNERLSLCDKKSKTPVACTGSKITSDGLMPHPDDCQLFYYCVNENMPPVCRECPAGLHFNPKIHACDWPHQAGCHSSTGTT